ncbi:uncharacterized protein LOC130285449 [Hyla sarda]|uniref:uncharacterized protein LOC130285449 n=1 Tax=Hyla sarda TaxID=327740 RepID=UPI0024C35884|nr:uncharacterized protein LOC130285449 [Hyla sarda]
MSQKSSHKSRSVASVSTKASSISSAVAIARAKAEAAKTRAAFAEQEMQIKIEKARLEATLEKLAAEKEAAATIAEAEFLEAIEYPETLQRDSIPGMKLKSQDPLQRTSEYVNELPGSDSNTDPVQKPKRCTISEIGPVQHEVPSWVNYKQENNSAGNNLITGQAVKPDHLTVASPLTPRQHDTGQHNQETTNRYEHTPYSYQGSTPPVYPAVYQTTMDFAKFFTRRELVAKGIVTFNDRPEDYRAWRSSFQNVTRDLDLSCSEEVDLLVKYLGEESSKHAARIRAININYPETGLKMIWSRLDECYGSAEVIESALYKRIEDFPRITNKGYQKLRELSDLLMELQVAKSEGDLQGLAYLDTARGVNPLVQKLPFNLQEKWITHGSTYKYKHNVPFPPFSVFVDFVHNQAKIRNDPSFDLTLSCATPVLNSRKTSVAVHKTNVSPPDFIHRPASQAEVKARDPSKQCPIHQKPHPLLKCRAFREKPVEDRKRFLKENGICYKCCGSTSHFAKDCKVSVKCTECDTTDHNTALHPGPAPWASQSASSDTEHGGEKGNTAIASPEVTSQCTEVCKGTLGSRSCSKICLVRVYPKGQKDKAVKLYAILDDQSNRSLARSTFFDIFKTQGPSTPYSLKTCAGTTSTMGRKATGYQIESLDGQTCLPLPTIIECNQIPDNRSEIPTREVASYHSHLKSMAHLIPELDHQAQIILLLGRDILQVHKVRRHINGPNNAPYAQKLDLGWVIIGDVCLGRMHTPTSVTSMLTNMLDNGRPSLFQPCNNNFHVKELPYCNQLLCTYTDLPCDSHAASNIYEDQLGCTVFQRTTKDNQVAMSIEDKLFLDIMHNGFVKDETNSWVAPLPFRSPRQRLPNNREQALKRFSSLKHNLQRKQEMRNHFFTFMKKIFENGHAEIAPKLKDFEECWYLPMFGVYHPKKPGQIRVVFDSSAKFEGVSLNDVLLTGPDLNNKLMGVLMRFRNDSIAFTADIQQMFHCFLVKKEDRNFLRFLWYRDNDLSKEVIEYRMRVHIFGNSPSPSVAIYGLKRSAQEGEAEYGSDVRKFVEKDFYVDDCLKAMPSNETAINLLRRAQEMLAYSNLRLHKIASNSQELIEAFPSQDRCSDLKDLDLGTDPMPVQRSLGHLWNLKSDTFIFQASKEEKPFTRRGVLSTINSLYDPLGFAAPVTIQGKALLRNLTRETSDWDTPLPADQRIQWEEWKNSLTALSKLNVARPYAPVPSTEIQSQKLYIFSDASVKAIAAVAYIKTMDSKGQCHVGFVMGKTKLAPYPEHTVPRLELCAAVLAVEVAELITSE